jgi:hypothetical protein
VSELDSIERLFRGRHFDREVIILCVRWYLRYKLSFRDLVEMMSERGLHLAHTTILLGCGNMRRSSSSAGIASPGQLVAPGESMRLLSRSVANGLTCIERWTRLARLLTSGSESDGTLKQRRRPSIKQSDMKGGRPRQLLWMNMPPPIAQCGK